MDYIILKSNIINNFDYVNICRTKSHLFVFFLINFDITKNILKLG